MIDEGLTPVEVRDDGTSRSIVIPLDGNLITSMESVVTVLVPFCSSIKRRTLEKSFKDADFVECIRVDSMGKLILLFSLLFFYYLAFVYLFFGTPTNPPLLFLLAIFHFRHSSKRLRVHPEQIRRRWSS